MNEIKVTSEHGGWLSHYFHFLIDFAHPFHDWYASSGLLFAEEPLTVHLEIRGEKDRLHEMAQRFSQLYPSVTLREVPSDEFARLDCKAVTTQGWKARGRKFESASVVSFGRFHAQRAGGGTATGADVVFVDRGVEAKATGRKNGAQRRNISNSDALALRLAAEFGDGFVRAVLEQLSMHEQIRLFRDSRCFVGSHGAGFANIIFCERLSASIIEVFNREPGEKQHFITLAAARGMHHAYVQIPERDAPVDVEALVSLVKAQSR